VVESYLDEPTQVKISVLGASTHLKNLATGEIIDGKAQETPSTQRTPQHPQRTEFQIDVQPHSFVAFSEE
jgi:hypothetical protein